MFESISKRLKGILTEAALKKKSNIYYEQIIKDPNNKIARSIEDNNIRESWESWHNEFVGNVAKANNRYDQVIELRRATMAQIEELAYSGPFVKEEYSDDEKRTLAKVMDKDREYEDVIRGYILRYIYSQTSWQVFRYISLEFGDASVHDWSELYESLNDQYVEHAYKRAIKYKNQEEDIFEELEDALINTIQQKLEEVKKGILEGNNYEYDREAVEKEQEEEQEQREHEDQEKEREEEAKRKATKTITSSQIQDLTEFMIERYERIKNGELYKIEEYSPVNAYGALEVDSGIMLIALSECVADFGTAKDGLRKVMWNFVKAIGNEKDLEGKNYEDVNTEVAEEIYNIRKDNEDGGWMSSVVLIAVQYLYDIVLSDFTDEEQREIGRLSTGMIDDTWGVFANTKNVFGYEINTEKMFK